MTTRKKANPPEGNPFEDGFLDWMDSPDGEQSMAVMETVLALLDEVAVDAKARQLIWPDGQRLSIDQSVQRIHAEDAIEGRVGPRQPIGARSDQGRPRRRDTGTLEHPER